MSETPAPSLPRWALIPNATPNSLAEALAIAFRTRGINVISTTPSASKAVVEHISPTTGTLEGFLIRIQLNPTSSKSLRHAVEIVEQLTNNRLSYLLNCPATTTTEHSYGYRGPLLDIDIARAKKAYDTNVWAPLAIVQAFFPLLRAGRGIVVNQTTVAGLQGYSRPFVGIRSSATAAARSLNDVMRVEFQPFGVRVVGLVLGAVKTDQEMLSRFGVRDGSAYVLIRDKVEKFGSSEGSGHDRFEVAEKIVEVLLQEDTPKLVKLGRLATFIWLLHWLLPMWLLDLWHTNGSGLGRLKVRLDAEGAKKEE